MPVGTPCVETKQDCLIAVEKLPKIIMCGCCFRKAKQRLIPFEVPGHVGYANDRALLQFSATGALSGQSGHGSLRCREIKLFADKLDHLGDGRGAKTEGALDNAGFAANVTRDVEGRCCPLRSARITSKPLIFA
jgi:hypothetical protein